MHSLEIADTVSTALLSPQKVLQKTGKSSLETPLTRKASQLSEEPDNLPKVLFLAAGFLLLFSAYSPVQNMVSVLFKQLGESYLGIFALIVVNQAYGIASLIVPMVAPKLSYRKVFATCAVCFVVFIYIGKLISSCEGNKTSFVCQSQFIYAMMIGASILTGFGLAFIWFTCSVYVQACSNENNKGKMFGIFGAIKETSNITGALLTLVLLKWFGVSGFFLCQTLFAGIAVCLFTRVQNPAESHQEEPLAKPEPVNLSKLIHFMNKPKMKGYYPLIAFSSYSFGFMVVNLSKMSAATVQHLPQDEANVKVGYVLLFFGISELIASLVSGGIFDKSKELAVKVIIGFGFVVAFLNFFGYNFNSYLMFFPIGFCFGFLDSGIQVVLGALIASRFDEVYEPFAIFRFVQGLLQAFCFLVVLFLESVCPQMMFVVHFGMAMWAWKHRANY